jgi:Kef-type K+ transport system membrane component KefB
MEHEQVPQFLGLLVVMLAAAKLLGMAAARLGQPPVLGELLAGVLLGSSVFGLADPRSGLLHLLSEFGVVLLLFEIGLETDLVKLLHVGSASAVVALAGVVLPFLMGYAACRTLGLAQLVSVVVGAALTATSVGITARVLSDLGKLQEPESQIILGAAVIDDVIGLVILAIVESIAHGEAVTLFGIAITTIAAFGFLAGTVLIGSIVVPPLVKRAESWNVPGMMTVLPVTLAFGLAWLAWAAGSATIIGAFAAGLLLRRTPQSERIHNEIVHLGYFLIPLFFVSVGANVDLRALNPFDPAARTTILIGGILIGAGIAGKFIAGYAPYWITARKNVIGVGMMPRGEVGLIFAQMGLATKVFEEGMFSAVTLMVMVTTLLAPPLLRYLFAPDPSNRRATASH